MRKRRDIDTGIGKRIRLEREKVGWTRDRLAEMLDCSTSFISELERGNTGISITMLQLYCETMGVSSDFLIWGERERNYDPIIDKFRFLDDDNLVLLNRMIQTFLETVALNKKGADK